MKTRHARARRDRKQQSRKQTGGAGHIGDACTPVGLFGDSCDAGVSCVKHMCMPYPSDYAKTLLRMIEEGTPKVVARLLELDPTLVDKMITYNDRSMTPLMIAASVRENVRVVHVLLEAKANLRLKTTRGETALWLASKAGRLGNVSELIMWDTSLIDTPDVGFTTPLMIAAIRDYPLIVDALLEAGANPAIGDAQKRTALMIASEQGNSESVLVLLRKAPATLDLQDLYGNTALMRSIGNHTVFHQLLTAGANTMLSTRKGETVRSLAEAKSPMALQLLTAATVEEREALLRRTPQALFNAARLDPASLLGKGGYGSVRAVERNGTPYALKRMVFDPKYTKGNGIKPSHREDYNVEVRGLGLVKSSPYVLHLVDSDVSSRNAYLLTEKLEGMDLLKAIDKKIVNDSNVREVAVQLLKGLESIHDQGLLHLDIKPNNLWVTPAAAGRPLQLK